MRRRWAEYLTVIATGLFIPLDIYEIFKAPTLLKCLLLLVNLAVVAYLVVAIRGNPTHGRSRSARN